MAGWLSSMDFIYAVVCVYLRDFFLKQKQKMKINFGNDLVHCTADRDQVTA